LKRKNDKRGVIPWAGFCQSFFKTRKIFYKFFEICTSFCIVERLVRFREIGTEPELFMNTMLMS